MGNFPKFYTNRRLASHLSTAGILTKAMQETRPSTPIPAQNDDGSLTSVVLRPSYHVGRYLFLELAIPSHVFQGNPFGRFVMARCSHTDSGPHRTDWSIYLRRPLFVAEVSPVAGRPDTAALTLLLPQTEDAGYRLLARLAAESPVNLLGPFGREVRLPAHARHLLAVASAGRAPLVLPAIERMLDSGGRVSLIVREHTVDQGLLSLLPLPVEIHAAAERNQWTDLIMDGIGWADSMIICDPVMSPQAWFDTIRLRRMAVDEEFAQILMAADLVCCTGACMACVVPRSDGSLTRACVHGPVFPLTSLVRNSSGRR